MGFKLDTTGHVDDVPGWDHNKQPIPLRIFWHDLDAFTQGYVEGVLMAAEDTLGGFTICGIRFSDLAPETLAGIIADCEAILAAKPALYDQIYDGKMVWRHRQDNRYPDFPPLTVQLGDDGKVRFV